MINLVGIISDPIVAELANGVRRGAFVERDQAVRSAFAIALEIRRLVGVFRRRRRRRGLGCGTCRVWG